ncbi:MAG: hypothetical protein K0S68_833 [Candidatus Saccharibacteria bacterium]|jgi:hypothetical protein|nr:hypothetical protein [Candidatus Saccharibacteria bacterium]
MAASTTWEARLANTIKRVVTRLSVSPFRLIAFILHATGLERIYKPHFTRYSALLDLTDEVVAKLPKHSMSISGARMDLMNLIFVGSEIDIKLAFKAAGWNGAHPASPLHLLYSALTTLFHRSYYSGPFTPHYVNIGLQDMSFQQLTRTKSFSQRHHLRIFRTGIKLPGKKRVWVGAACYDDRLKIQFKPPFIHHNTDPDLDKEREYVVRSLEAVGVARLKTVVMNQPTTTDRPYQNAHGAKYYTDGRAVVVQV